MFLRLYTIHVSVVQRVITKIIMQPSVVILVSYFYRCEQTCFGIDLAPSDGVGEGEIFETLIKQGISHTYSCIICQQLNCIFTIQFLRLFCSSEPNYSQNVLGCQSLLI